jgi:hypothetical protein
MCLATFLAIFLQTHLFTLAPTSAGDITTPRHKLIIVDRFFPARQADYPDKLPAITASLFQSPGGRKFLAFVARFTKFVVWRQLKSQAAGRQPVVDHVSKASGPLAKLILPQLTSDNNKDSQDSFAQLVGLVLCNIFKQWKLCLSICNVNFI